MTQSSQSWKHPFLDSVTVRRVTQKEAGYRQEDQNKVQIQIKEQSRIDRCI